MRGDALGLTVEQILAGGTCCGQHAHAAEHNVQVDVLGARAALRSSDCSLWREGQRALQRTTGEEEKSARFSTARLVDPRVDHDLLLQQGADLELVLVLEPLQHLVDGDVALVDVEAVPERHLQARPQRDLGHLDGLVHGHERVGKIHARVAVQR